MMQGIFLLLFLLYTTIIPIAVHGSIIVTDCTDPGTPEHGYRIGNDFSAGSSVYFSCRSPYTLIGTETISCERKETRTDSYLTWSDYTPPVCTIVPVERTGPGSKCGKEPRAGHHAKKVSSDIKSVVVYTCNSRSYTMESGDRIIQCIDKEWIGTPMDCRRKAVCTEEPLTPHLSVIKSSGLMEGDTIHFSCSTGYKLSTNGVITCTATGEWSGPWPTCDIINCGRPPTVPNAFPHYTSTLYQSSVSYTCQIGYKQIGYTNTVTCGPEGAWSNVKVRCEVCLCPRPVRPVNGRVYYSSVTYNSTARYQCNKGYEIRNQSAIRQCSVNSTWIPEAPSCQPVSCGSLAHPVNGRVTYTSTTFRGVATYQCNRGYRLLGDKTRQCMSNASWSNQSPDCIIDCGSLFNPPNGRVSFNSTTLYSTAIYSCNNNYVLKGRERRTCTANGNWNGTTPTCVLGTSINCGTLANPPNGLVAFNTTHYNSIAVYTCNDGYKLTGSSQRVCNSNGDWTLSRPSCLEILCRHLPNPTNGFIKFTKGRRTGSAASYNCNKGYKLIGEDMTYCSTNGTWSLQTEPKCNIVNCHSPPLLSNGTVSFNDTTFNSIARYNCSQGLTLTGGSPLVRCQANGTWRGVDQLTCKVDCGLIQLEANTRVLYVGGTLLGAVAKHYCIPGYFILGNGRRECQSDGTWSPLEHLCQPVNCGEPPQIENGEVIFFNTTLAHPARYQCRVGFELIGMELRVCTINGRWSGDTPRCKIIDCGAPPTPLNGRVQFNSTIFTSRARYTCSTGYILQGPTFGFCAINGNWSSPIPTCEAVDCGMPDNVVANGNVHVTTTTFNSTVTYLCHFGYRLEGVESGICSADGNWSIEPPTCVFIDCGDPGLPTDGYRNFISTFFNATVTYSCPNNLQLYGNGLRICQRNGKWSGQLPTCGAITSCSDPGVPYNGRRIINNNLLSFPIDSLVYHICNDGFDLYGSKVRQCQHTGRWTGTLVTCVPMNSTCTQEGQAAYDSTGRRCHCTNKTLTNCCRYRQDWLQLSYKEKKLYLDTVKRASSDPLYKPLYRTLMSHYYNSSRTLAQSLDPSNTQFLPWHRYYLQNYEDMLRMINPKVYVPYWDWTLLPRTPYDHPIFSSSNGFGNSSNRTTKCVINGPFAKGRFSLTSISGGGCLRREYSQTTPLLTRHQLNNIILTQSSFTRFFSFLTLPYLTVRCSLGGNLCDINSSPPTEDPLHSIIISFIDYIWYKWQITNGHANRRYDKARLVKTFKGEEMLTVGQYNDAKMLPYNIATCYGPSVNSLYTRQRKQVSYDNNNDNNPIACPLKEWLVKLGLDKKKIEIIQAICNNNYTN